MAKEKRERTQAQLAADRLRPGRPPIKASLRQTERIMVRMTPALRKRLEKQAKAEGISLAELIMKPWHEKGES